MPSRVILTAVPATLAAALLTIGSVEPPRSAFQPPHPLASTFPICRVEADPENKFTRIPAPSRFEVRALATDAAVITVSYTGFTPQAQAAFQYAVDIWQSQLTSTVPIRIDAQFADLGPSTLGSAGATYVYRDYPAFPFSGTWYAKALANKLAGSDLNAGAVDIEASFSSTFGWYYGTDGFTPAGQYDFVSVVLHELAHGLGFFGSMSVSSTDGTGNWGWSTGYPTIYDQFTENGSAQLLLNTTLFPNPSLALAGQLTGGAIYWNGSHGKAANGGARPRLYAPATWKPGSSFSHLDEATYPAGDPNSLMTYAIGAAEAIHDPGPIVRGIFTDEGWTACVFAVSPSSASYGVAGGSGGVTVTTASGCAWTASTGASWIHVTSGAAGTGSGAVGYSVDPNSGRARSATLSVAGHTVTISQLSPLPTITPDRPALRYGAVNNGSTLNPGTQSQVVRLTQSGGTPVAWTATANQSWVQIANGSGTGSGQFTVSVSNTGGLPLTGSVTATVTVSAPAAASDPTIALTLVLYASGTTKAPFGVVETPLNGATGVAGAIPVTGWALDDVQVNLVQIWRNPVPGLDPPAGSLPNGKVYLGDATFVPDARPDVASAYPTYPLAYRAGWGYMLLTNMLPHQVNLTSAGGQGTYTLYAYASDLDGHTTLLGQRTITLDNDNADKPFGTIDTPAQGGTASGAAYANFGWALTPYRASMAIVPRDGSTIQVFVDGAPKGHPTYDLCRGSTAPDPPGGLGTCDDDIATLFPGRTNITMGNGAIGVFTIDTTAVANGLHTIAWSVTDSDGKADGLGSRFFTVFNSGSSLVASPASTAGNAATDVNASVADLVPLPQRTGAVWLQLGYAAATAGSVPLVPSEGVVQVVAPETERLTLDLASDGQPVWKIQGYLVIDGHLDALPVGSSLDERYGRFSWQPGPGQAGPFDLVFFRFMTNGAADALRVHVVLGGNSPDVARR